MQAAVQVPLLRKDFCVTDYQLLGPRRRHQPEVLLIVAASPMIGSRLWRPSPRAGPDGAGRGARRGGDRRALDLGAELIGSGARNLKDPRGRPGHLLPAGQAGAGRSCWSPSRASAVPTTWPATPTMGRGWVLVGEALSAARTPEAAVRAMTGCAAGTRPGGS
ncbi:MAG: hypothetical protein R2734_10435 [Nocardioides sp.]